MAVRRTTTRVGLILISVLVAFALLGPLVAHHDPFTTDTIHGATSEHLPVGPGREYWLGTDRLFRDVFARLAVGGRVSLGIGLGATMIATTLGAIVGIVAGYHHGRWVDTVLMRVIEIGLAFPFLLVVMALGAALDRTTASTIVL